MISWTGLEGVVNKLNAVVLHALACFVRGIDQVEMEDF